MTEQNLKDNTLKGVDRSAIDNVAQFDHPSRIR